MQAFTHPHIGCLANSLKLHLTGVLLEKLDLPGSRQVLQWRDEDSALGMDGTL